SQSGGRATEPGLARGTGTNRQGGRSQGISLSVDAVEGVTTLSNGVTNEGGGGIAPIPGPLVGPGSRYPRSATGTGLPCGRRPKGRRHLGVAMTRRPNSGSKPARGLHLGVFAVIAVGLALFSIFLLIPIIIIVANRAEPDQRGVRPQSVYLFGMSFVTLQLTFAGSVLIIISSLFSVIAP